MKRFLVWMIGLYQRWISPMKAPCCRFYPSCSRYALESLERFGVLRGGLIALWRILRCNPWNKGGVDPVPEKWRDGLPFSEERKGRGAGQRKIL